jgi:hypothetical protein
MSKIINKMYGGSVEVVFDPLKHNYSRDGVTIKSVTKVLDIISKPWLVPWAAKITTERMAELLTPGVSYDEIQLTEMLDTAKRASYSSKKSAGDIGTLVHDQVEQIIKGNPVGELIHEEANLAVKRFVNWIEQNNVHFVLSEQMVYSQKYNFCGTLDFACVINNQLVLGDLKTSNQIDKVNYGAQLAAYKLAREEEYGEKFHRCVLVRTGKKEGEFELWEPTMEEMEKYKQIFLSALELSNNIDSLNLK